MNQPNPPYGPQQPAPYGHGPGQPDPYGQQYEVSYPTGPGYGPQYGGQPGPQPGPYGGQPGPGGYGPPPQRSKLPIWIATGLVVALAAGLGLFFLLRAPGPEEVTMSFFEAVDAMDEQGMKDNARGEVEDDIDDIMDGEAQDLGVTFSEGNATDSATKAVDDVELAVVIWELDELPDDIPADQGELAVALLDDGDGFRVCQIDAPYEPDAKEVLEDFEMSYEDVCAYTG